MPARHIFLLRALSACLVLGLVLSACGGSAARRQMTAASSPPASEARLAERLPYRWLISAGALRRLSQAGLPSALLAAYFNRPSTILIGAGARPDPLVPEASRAADFTSAAALVRALRSDEVPVDERYVILDIEAWPLTPPAEQRQPIRYLTEALAAARDAGKQLVFTPGTDLVKVLMGHQVSGSALSADYNRLLAGPGAAESDVFEIQAQGTEGAATAGSFAASALAAARASRPGEPVLVGLSTNPDGRSVTPADLLQLARSVPSASGFWLNVPEAGKACPRCGTAQPQVAVSFLEQLA